MDCPDNATRVEVVRQCGGIPEVGSEVSIPVACGGKEKGLKGGRGLSGGDASEKETSWRGIVFAPARLDRRTHG